MGILYSNEHKQCTIMYETMAETCKLEHLKLKKKGGKLCWESHGTDNPSGEMYWGVEGLSPSRPFTHSYVWTLYFNRTFQGSYSHVQEQDEHLQELKTGKKHRQEKRQRAGKKVNKSCVATSYSQPVSRHKGSFWRLLVEPSGWRSWESYIPLL